MIIIILLLLLIGVFFLTIWLLTHKQKLVNQMISIMPIPARKIITENDVKMFCVNSNGVNFMCKNCGREVNSLSVSRTDADYCPSCGCWLCHTCRHEPCEECKTHKQNDLL